MARGISAESGRCDIVLGSVMRNAASRQTAGDQKTEKN